MVKVWDVATESCAATLSGHGGGVFALAALHDGRLASGSGDKTVKLWDVAAGSCVSTLSADGWPPGERQRGQDGKVVGRCDRVMRLHAERAHVRRVCPGTASRRAVGDRQRRHDGEAVGIGDEGVCCDAIRARRQGQLAGGAARGSSGERQLRQRREGLGVGAVWWWPLLPADGTHDKGVGRRRA